jgi:aspartate aminotransferase
VNALIQTGDDVLMHVPYWVSFPDLITYAGGRPVQVLTRVEDGFQLRAEEVEKAITPRTKMLILNSPGNPTGAVVPPDEYQRIYEVCVRHNIWLLADECYSHFVYGDAKPYSIGSKAGSKEHIIIAGSLSKTFAMTGWRAGYALAPKAVIEAMVRLQSQSTSNACSITQKAAHAAMIGPMGDVAEMLSEYEKRRKHILAGLRGIPGIKCTAPQGAFYVFPDVSHFAGARGFAADTSTMAKEIIERAHVAVVAGEGFGAPGYLRLSYATSMERIDEGVRRLARYFTAAASAS